jgi:serpin B
VDFTQDSTLEDVNEWVSDRTEGMIDPFMEEFHNEENLRLFLVNAIYFNGKWSLPFSPEATRRTPFYGLSATRNVDMMYMSETEYRYYSDKGMRGVEIPYGEGRLVMDVLIPEDTQNTTIGEVYGALTEEEINQFLEQLDLSKTTELGTLAIPKFEMEYGMVNLNSALQELGMKHAFDEYLADFGLIGKELFVSQVVHKAKIQVEEWGSKAAAATGIEMETTSALLEEPLRFIVDVPFIFFIRDKQTDAILFMGEMNQIN